MSSFLPLGPDGWGQIVDEREVSIDTIDNYCMRNRISSIDLLKSDTQGFNLEVIKEAHDPYLGVAAFTFCI
jgi:FkbM family methyltransferase